LIPLNTPAVLTFVGDGTEQITFPISFPTFEQSNVEVEVVTPTSELIVLENGTHYSLQNIGIPNTDASLILAISPSFSWTNPNGLKENYALNIKFTTNAEQPAKLRDLGRFAPEVFEKVLDRLTMNILAIREVAVSFKSQIESLVEKVIAIEESDAQQQEAIEDLSERVEDLESDVTDLKSDVEEIEDTLEDLDDRISSIESSPAVPPIIFKSEDFTAEFNKIHVIFADGSESFLGDGDLSAFEIPFVFDPLTLSVKAISPTLEETLLVEGDFTKDYYVEDSFVILWGGPGKPWLADGGFGGLEVGWTLTVEASIGDINVTLPAPQNTKAIYIKKTGSNLVTLIRNGSEKIDNVAANKSLTSAKESVTLICDGVDWFII